MSGRWWFVATYATWTLALVVWPDRMMLPTVCLLCLRALLEDVLKRLRQDADAECHQLADSMLQRLRERQKAV